MGISLDKVEEEAPHLVNMYKAAGVTLEKEGIDPEESKAAVLLVVDFSGSTKLLYADGTMQQAADAAFVAGLKFDDDGAVPAALFDDKIRPLGDITLENCKGFLQGRGEPYFGTHYLKALRWIVTEAGYNPNLKEGGGGFLRGPRGLKVQAKCPYPVYAVFVTDGEPSDSKTEIAAYLRLMSQYPIFVQFVGVGDHEFEFLRGLDEMEGRLVDNANFFDVKEVGDDPTLMLEKMLGEFPDYYQEARKVGLILP